MSPEKPFSGIIVQPGLDFHHLPEKTEETLHEVNRYIYHAPTLYPRLLDLLAQHMDKVEQTLAEARLKKNIAATPKTIHSPELAGSARFKRDIHKSVYRQTLSTRSAHLALSQIRESPDVPSRHQQGYLGGEAKIVLTDLEADPSLYSGIRTEIRVLHSLNPHLLNQPMIEHTFSHYPAVITRREAFQQAGLPACSPEYKLSLLAQLALNAKRGMVKPILEAIAAQGKIDLRLDKDLQAKTAPITLNRKKDYLSWLILGCPGPPNFFARMGTEFFSGYLKLVHQEMDKQQARLPQADRSRALKIIETATFMRTSQKKSGQSSEDLFNGILLPLAQHDLASAEREIVWLMIENPNLWPDYVKNLFPISPAERTEITALVEQRNQIYTAKQQQAIAAEKAQRQQAREAKKASRPQPPDAHDPSYRPIIDPFLGQTITGRDMFGTYTYTFLEYAVKTLRDGTQVPGFVKTRVVSVFYNDVPGRSTSLLTYASVVAKIKAFQENPPT